MDEESPLKRYCNLIAIGLLILGLFFYLYRIDSFWADDDEGNFSYGSWRVALGEMPVRDFLTDQPPLLLYWGGAVMRVFGPSVMALRSVTVLATLLAAFIIYLTAKEVFGCRVALLSLPLFLVHQDVYPIARVYRAEAYVLLFGALGAYAVVRARPDQRRLFFLSGALFGVAMLFKLTAAWPLAGCGLFLLWWLYRSRDKRLLGDLLALAAGVVATAGTVLVFFQVQVPAFFSAVLLFNERISPNLSRSYVLIRGLRFFRSYFQGNPAFLLATLLGAVISVLQERGRSAFYAWQIPTLGAFLLISRRLQERWLVYLVPALCVLAAVCVERIWKGDPARYIIRVTRVWATRAASGWSGLVLTRILPQIVAVLVVVLSLWPFLLGDQYRASWEEQGTLQIAQYIQEHTDPDDVVLCDSQELNVQALRKTTYLAADLSEGATVSGYITGADLIQEIEAEDVQMVWINTYGGAHHMLSLRDYDAFYAYVQRHFHLVRLFHRTYQTFEAYNRRELMSLQPGAEFGGKLALTGAQLGSDAVRVGQSLPLALRWQALKSLDRDYTASVHLVDEQGHSHGQHDMLLEREFTSKPGVSWLTAKWPAGLVVMNEYVLPVAAATPAGKYRLVVQVYDQASGEVLPVRDAQGQERGLDCALAAVEVVRP